MPRRGAVPKRPLVPDVKYGDPLVGRMITVILRCGKKSTAESIMYRALDIVAQTLNTDGVDALTQALKNAAPKLEVRPRRVGGATYQVPMEVKPERGISLAMRWVIHAARDRGERGMEKKLAAEILDAYNKRGGAIKKREDVHRMAESNRAFAHYRW